MISNKKKQTCIILALSIFLSASQSAAMPSFMERAYPAQKKACQAGFNREYIKAGTFTLTTYERLKAPSNIIRVYIEGDGRAWETRSRLSDDPTPSNPVALTLAVADPSDAVAYIARPGQFPAPDSAACAPAYWSNRRFSPEIVEAFDKAIDILKAKAGAKAVELVGYSGGAAIAVLVAARRSDVLSIRTVAGNLDPKALCEYHKVSQLEGSMDPLDAAQKIINIPQRHFVSASDSVVPMSITKSFAGKIGDQKYESITMVEGANHITGWQKAWPVLINVPLYKRDRLH